MDTGATGQDRLRSAAEEDLAMALTTMIGPMTDEKYRAFVEKGLAGGAGPISAEALAEITDRLNDDRLFVPAMETFECLPDDTFRLDLGLSITGLDGDSDWDDAGVREARKTALGERLLEIRRGKSRCVCFVWLDAL